MVTRRDRLSRSANSEDAQMMLQTLLDHKVKGITETDLFDLGQSEDAEHWCWACGRWTERAASSARGRRVARGRE